MMRLFGIDARGYEDLQRNFWRPGVVLKSTGPNHGLTPACDVSTAFGATVS